MKKDKIYAEEKNKADFNFGKETAEVFDDMLQRSIPLYDECQRMIGEICNEFAQDGTNIYDLGCSTGITLMNLSKSVNKNVKFVGMDYSQAMLDKCKEKFIEKKFEKPYQLICQDLNDPVKIENASVVVLNLTLQFVRPLYRDRLIQTISAGLKENGALIVVEKVLGNDSGFNRMFIKLYYDFKMRQGYSELEIAQKREALENVLIPYRLQENEELFRRNGFKQVDVFYKWYNFCGIIAIK